ncbi:MAG TPA: hypothetical protein VM778_01565 [Gemmatimonadota bacterium]|nr:hypothetical protein [Gemmatimonadota bacterium]
MTSRVLREAARLPRSVVALLVAAACAGASAGAGELDAEMEEFYAAWETEVADAMRELDSGDRQVFRGIWPRAEFEGATADVLAVLRTEPSLRPTVVRLERFLQFGGSNRVREQLRNESVDRRLWRILIDTVNRELAGR